MTPSGAMMEANQAQGRRDAIGDGEPRERREGDVRDREAADRATDATPHTPRATAARRSPWAVRGELATFDVWDTLLRRRCHPDEVKLATAANLLVREPRVAAEHATTWSLLLLRQRVEAEIGAKRRVLGLDDEYRIEEVIPEWIARACALVAPDERVRTLADALIDEEVAHEMFVTSADPLGTSLVRDAARQAGLADRAGPHAPIAGETSNGDGDGNGDGAGFWHRRPIAVSDFYMGERHLSRILAAAAPGLPLDAVVVSCDVGLNKRSGRLFGHVHQRFHASPTQHVHIGDSVHADVETARRLGCRPVHFANPVPDARRRAHEARFAHRASGLAHDWALALRACEGLDAHAAVARDDGYGPHATVPMSDRLDLARAGFRAAPLLVGFVLSVLEEALRVGASRVYYFTREGEFFARVHRAIAEATGGGRGRLWGVELPEARVLHVSRVATFLPSLREVTTREMMRLWNQYSTQSMGQMLASLGLNGLSFEGMLAAHGLSLDERIVYPWGDDRVQSLFADRRFTRTVERARDDARTLLSRYLREQGVHDERDAVVVDIGWRGTIQDNIAHVLPNVTFHGVYLGMQRTLNDQPANVRKRAFGPDMRLDDAWTASLLDEVAPLEMATNAPGGSVTGYRPGIGGRVEPVRRADPREDHAFHHATRYVQAGVVHATATVVEWYRLRGTTTRECRPLAIGLLRQIVEAPPPALARAFFGLSHNETFGAGGFQAVRAALPRGAARRWWRTGPSGSTASGDDWSRVRRAALASRWPHGLLVANGLGAAAQRLSDEFRIALSRAGSDARDPETVARRAAERELAWIEGSRSWRVVRRVALSWPGRTLARARFGPTWAHGLPEASGDPIARLARVKRSRAYRLILWAQRTALTRAARRVLGRAGPLLPS
jgi:FMN phosphatase YigB (HAD superfamily)